MNKRTSQNGILIVMSLALLGGSVVSLHAQAGPGPIMPNPPSNVPPPTSTDSSQSRPVLQVRPDPRTSIVGAWTLNRNQSDNDQNRPQQNRQNQNGPYGGNNGPYGNGPYGGRRRGGIGYPGGGYPGGGYPAGGGGRNRGGVNQNAQERQELQQMLRPANSLKIDQKDYQVFFSDDQGRETIFFTDGRKISSSNDPKHQQVSAKWDGPRLVTNEKDLQGRKYSRTFELSGDGIHLEETIEFENNNNGRLNSPMTMHYVYDIPPDKKS